MRKPATNFVLVSCGFAAGLLVALTLIQSPRAAEARLPAMPAKYFPELISAGVDGEKLVETNLFIYEGNDGPAFAVIPADSPNLSVAQLDGREVFKED